MSVLTSDRETQIVTCGTCEDTLEVSLSDDSPFIEDEQVSGQLDDAGWQVIDGKPYCPVCQPEVELPYLDEVDMLADYQRERDRL